MSDTGAVVPAVAAAGRVDQETETRGRNMWFRTLAKKAEESFWKKLGRRALNSAVDAVVEETIEACVEIWKEKRLKVQKERLDAVDFATEFSSADDDEESASGESRGPAEDEVREDERDAADQDRGAGSGIESLASYAARHEVEDGR